MLLASSCARARHLFVVLPRSLLTAFSPSGRRAVPKVFREALVGAGWGVGRSPVHHAVTATDGTTKVRTSRFNPAFESWETNLLLGNKPEWLVTLCWSILADTPQAGGQQVGGDGGDPRRRQGHA